MVIFCLYLALGLGFLLSAAPNPLHGVIGHDGVDLYKALWDIWWYQHSLLEVHTLPFFTPLLAYPQGAANYITDPIGALLSLPWQALGNLALGYNFLALFYLMLASGGAYLLAHELTGDRRAAFLAGLLFAYSPYMLSNLYNGALNTFNLGWIPLYLLYWRRSTLQPGPGNIALAAGCFVLGAVSGWYYAVVMLLFTLGLVAHQPRTWQLSLKILAWAALGCLPWAGLFIAHLLHPLSARPERLSAPLAAILLKDTSLSLDACFKPSGALHSDFLQSQYLGWSVVLLALLGAWKFRPATRIWLGLALGFLLLSLGFFLAWDNRFVLLGGRLIPLPGFALYKYLPGFSLLWFPYRMLAGFWLCLALLAAWGGRALLAFKLKPLLLLGVLCAVTLGEYFGCAGVPVPLPATSTQLPQVYARIAREAEPFGVLELPFISQGFMHNYSYYFYTQTAHRHPIALNFTGEIPGFLFANPLTRWLQGQETADAPARGPASAALQAGARSLERQGYKYLILHAGQYRTEAWQRISAGLKAVLAPPERCGEIRIYSLRSRP